MVLCPHFDPNLNQNYVTLRKGQNMADSRHNQYLPGYKASQVIHHEWRTAENSAAYIIPKLVSLREQNPQLSFLDVGAGSGTISVGLAKYIPEGKVTATDLSDVILEREFGDQSRGNGHCAC